jgi:hypothetical protein
MRLSPFMSRCAALLMLGGAILLLWLVLLQPFVDSWIAHRESIGDSLATLAKYKQLNSSRAAVYQNLQQLRLAQKSESRLLTGGSSQLAGAKLQNHIKEIVDSQKGTLISVQTLPVQDEEGFQKISIIVVLNTNLDSLMTILYDIEYQTPYLFVDGLDIRRNAGVMASASEGSDTLQVQFEIYGYMAKTT